VSAGDAKLRIGTSGWNYKAWKDTFFRGVKQKEWLEHYTTRFNAVEVNATFYRLLKENVLQGWLSRTPAEFRFAVKGSRYISHTKRLNDPLEPVRRQRDNLDPLRERIGAVIWQLPASMEKNLQRLQDFLRVLRDEWSWAPHAFEFRHASWFDREVADMLEQHSMAVCISDAADWPMWDEVAGDMAYVRLHGNRETYQSEYTEQELRQWADRARGWLSDGKTVHFYFDNTDAGAAPRNALRLRELLEG
jgi:uncharacterized protein YecE (DUF72 family)